MQNESQGRHLPLFIGFSIAAAAADAAPLCFVVALIATPRISASTKPATIVPVIVFKGFIDETPVA